LDKIPEELYPEIIENTMQIEEWKNSYAINEIEEDLTTVGYSEPLSIEFLRQNKFLLIDTKYFSSDFKEKLLSLFDEIDENINGLLVHSDNFQALNLLSRKYKSRVKLIYLDPPYNTGDDGFLYKDNYRHASWLSLINDRIRLGLNTLSKDGVHYMSIGDDEEGNLRKLLDSIFPVKTIPYIWKSRTKPINAGDAKYRPQIVGEFVFQNQLIPNLKYFPLVSGQVRKYIHTDEHGKYRTTSILTSNLGRYRRETMRFEIAGYVPPEDKRWKAGEDEIRKLYDSHRLGFNEDGEPFRKHYEGEEDEQHIPLWTFLPEEITGTAESGKSELTAIVGNNHGLDSVKPKELISIFLNALVDKNELVMDYFAGSGTTAHAVINLNREDEGNRRYILAEMGRHFDKITIPRLKKVIYSQDWKNGKPVSREGISQIFKYIRLESYEDTLNNLVINLTQEQLTLLEKNPELREQYMLSYMLNNETENSTSLLNTDMFKNPFEYKLKIANGLETQLTTVDLVETFNYLLGIEVIRNERKECYNAIEDNSSEVPGAVKLSSTKDGEYTFKEIEGRTSDGNKMLIIWRTLSDDIVKDNAALDAYFLKKKYSTQDFEFNRIYVNGDNNLQNLKLDEERWKVVLIEEEFKKLMFDVQDV
ncbi:site-specific DNA-methyltransferase, partial [Bacillus circulans]|uniref:site-specific DNA-methyltransferase n=1 Tax=Niallia circulans TaxID=1397 RepID=UPI0015604A42